MEFNNQNEYINYTINEIIDRNIITENIQTRCAFCQETHNVRDCPDERLIEFEVICTTIFHHVRNLGEFILWLYSYLYRDSFAVRLKAFTIKNCGCNEHTTLDQCVNMLCLYMENTYTMGHQEGNEEVDTIREVIASMEARGREIISEEQEDPFKISSYQIVVGDSSKNCLCSICWEEKEETKFVTYLCNHEFCGECLINTLKVKPSRDELKCALCRGNVDFITFHSEETYNEVKQYTKK
jgi:hypothetical protein